MYPRLPPIESVHLRERDLNRYMDMTPCTYLFFNSIRGFTFSDKLLDDLPLSYESGSLCHTTKGNVDPRVYSIQDNGLTSPCCRYVHIVQHNTTQHNTIQHNTAQYNTMRHNSPASQYNSPPTTKQCTSNTTPHHHTTPHSQNVVM